MILRNKKQNYFFYLLFITSTLFATENFQVNGTCTIFQKRESIRAKVSIIKEKTKYSLVLIDELGVPLIIANDSLGNFNLYRSFPPLTELESSLTASTIIKIIKESDWQKKVTNKEKELTKIVHNNLFYKLERVGSRYTLYGHRNKLLVKFVLEPIK